jgi:hypothetical protein
MERVGRKKNGKYQVEKKWKVPGRKKWKETEIINKVQKGKKCSKTMK